MITHDRAHELLAAVALDAVESIEDDQIESHVNECPRCATELIALRDVASALGNRRRTGAGAPVVGYLEPAQRA